MSSFAHNCCLLSLEADMFYPFSECKSRSCIRVKSEALRQMGQKPREWTDTGILCLSVVCCNGGHVDIRIPTSTLGVVKFLVKAQCLTLVVSLQPYILYVRGNVPVDKG